MTELANSMGTKCPHKHRKMRTVGALHVQLLVLTYDTTFLVLTSLRGYCSPLLGMGYSYVSFIKYCNTNSVCVCVCVCVCVSFR